MRAGVVTAFFFIFLSVLATAVFAVHDEAGKVRCLNCHTKLPFYGIKLVFREDADVACIRCHREHHGNDGSPSHPVKIAPSMAVPADMPLDIRGRITCLTCHRYHVGNSPEASASPSFLRRAEVKTLCYSCHNKGLNKW